MSKHYSLTLLLLRIKSNVVLAIKEGFVGTNFTSFLTTLSPNYFKETGLNAQAMLWVDDEFLMIIIDLCNVALC